MKMKLFWMFGLLVWVAGCQKDKPVALHDQALPVALASIENKKLAKPVVISGILTSNSDAKLSFKIGGIIDAFYVREGDRVKAGQVLAALKMDEIEAQVAQAKSGFEKAERDYNRAKNLYEDSVATLEQFQNAETGLDVARANLKIARFNADHAKIVAPANGRVLVQLAEANEMIGPGHPIFMFASGQNAWAIKAGVPDREVVRLSVGDSATATFDVLKGQSFSARITEIAGGPDPMNGTYEVTLVLDDGCDVFYNGFVAQISIFPSKYEEEAVIPFEALVDAQGMQGFVFTPGPDSTARKIPVSIDFLTDDFVAVRAGLDDVSHVITEGASYLNDGQRIRVVQQ